MYERLSIDPETFGKFLEKGGDKAVSFFNKYGNMVSEDVLRDLIKRGPNHIDAFFKQITKGTGSITELLKECANYSGRVEKTIAILKNDYGFDNLDEYLEIVETRAGKKVKFMREQMAINVKESNILKGDIGEVVADLYMEEKGYIKIGGQKGAGKGKFIQSGRQGIDGIYFKDGQYYIIGDAKFGYADLAEGQMAEDWISERLLKATGDGKIG